MTTAQPRTDAQATVADEVIDAVEEIEDDNDLESFDWGKNENKPKTGEELYQALVASGFIGMWKDCTDIGDTLEYARELRERASTRHHE